MLPLKSGFECQAGGPQTEIDMIIYMFAWCKYEYAVVLAFFQQGVEINRISS